MPASTERRSTKRIRSRICLENTIGGKRKRITIDPNPTAAIPVDHDRIEVDDPTAREFDDALPRLAIPGTGEKRETTDDRLGCGEEGPILFCPNPDCGEPAVMKSACRQSRCPRCWESWAFTRMANDPIIDDNTGIAAKLEQQRLNADNGIRVPPKTPDGIEQKGPFFHHCVISMPGVRFDSKDPLDKAFQVVYALMSEVFADSGYAIYHPWRIKPEHRGTVRGHDGGDGDTRWKDIPDLIDEYGWEHIRDEYLVFEPHFHVLTCGYVETTQTERIERETGIVIHRITKERHPKVSLFDLDDLAAAGAYSLSHCGLQQQGNNYRAAVRPFGEVAGITAGDYATQKADEAMRSIAYDVLGVSFDKPTCNANHADDCPADCGHEHTDENELNHSDTMAPDTGCAADQQHDTTPSTAIATDGGPQLVGGDVTPSPDGLCDTHGRHAARDDASFDAIEEATSVAGEPEATDLTTRGDHDPETDTIPAGDTNACGTRLRPMYVVDDYLEDDDWCECVPNGTLDRLREARERWEELTKPKANEITIPDADDPPDD